MCFQFSCQENRSEETPLSFEPIILKDFMLMEKSPSFSKIEFSDKKTRIINNVISEILTGDVKIKLDSMEIICDTAYWFPGDNSLNIPGELKIISKKLQLEGSGLLWRKDQWEINRVNIVLFYDDSTISER
jgi:hypothetical protein